ncbi:MAG: hypothetical protein LBQ80_03755 [Clostridium sp.]|jgi:hypothetical protein|nr:hypothetical protein [Clostridium sp.]
MKKALKIMGCLLLCVLVAALGFVVWYGRNEDHRIDETVTENDYSRILQENITGNPRVVDIAMLCAHDAFSNKITSQSPLDPNDENQILDNSVLRAIVGGVFARQAKAQKSNGYELATRGVRYFDVRVCYDDGVWQNMHSFISAPFEENLRYLLRFLSENPGEMLVVDIQHHKPQPLTSQDMIDFIGTVEEDGKSLWDYVSYDPNEISLGELRFKDVTKDGAGVVVLIKTEQYEGCKFYEYVGEQNESGGIGSYVEGVSVRANWHNKPKVEQIIEGIEKEYAYLTENFELYKNTFRANQSQTTAPLDLGLFPYWSLLHDAEESNNVILAQPDFDKWLEVMPVLWTNNSDTMVDGYNDNVIARLNSFNRKLK